MVEVKRRGELVAICLFVKTIFCFDCLFFCLFVFCLFDFVKRRGELVTICSFVKTICWFACLLFRLLILSGGVESW